MSAGSEGGAGERGDRAGAGRVRRRLVVHGVVQGVGYRWSCAREAERLGLAGRVRNLDTGEVEIVAEGPADAVGRLEAWARRGPAYAMVTGVDVIVEEPQGLTWFHIDD